MNDSKFEGGRGSVCVSHSSADCGHHSLDLVQCELWLNSSPGGRYEREREVSSVTGKIQVLQVCLQGHTGLGRADLRRPDLYVIYSMKNLSRRILWVFVLGMVQPGSKLQFREMKPMWKCHKPAILLLISRGRFHWLQNKVSLRKWRYLSLDLGAQLTGSKCFYGLNHKFQVFFNTAWCSFCKLWSNLE